MCLKAGDYGGTYKNNDIINLDKDKLVLTHFDTLRLYEDGFKIVQLVRRENYK